MSRARPSGHHGVLVVDKPDGPTSHDVVAWVRRCLGERRIGHCGTLDPGATGVLVVAVGEATKLVPWLVDDEKVYDAVVRLGWSTTTGDRHGSVLESRAPAPGDLARAAAAVGALVGTHRLRPPVVSAVRIDGVRAHARARAGEVVELPERDMTVHAATVLAEDPETASIHVRLRVSKGTYVRTLAEVVGVAIGVPAHLAALRRVSSGRFDLAAAAAVGELVAESTGTRPDGKPRVRLRHATLDPAAAAARVAGALVPIADAVPPDWTRLTLDEPEFARLAQGQMLALPPEDAPAGASWALVRGPAEPASFVVVRIEDNARPGADGEAPAAPAAGPPRRLRPVRRLDPSGPPAA